MLEKASDNYGEFAKVKTALKKKDVIIMKLYALFMNTAEELSTKASTSSTDSEFLKAFSSYLNKRSVFNNLTSELHP